MKYITIVNPHGGKKLGLKILYKIKPIFEKANIELLIIETTFKGHAYEIANQLNLTQYDGLIGIGGDGTLHEIANGMFARTDGITIPIGMIPAGSGNSYMHDLKLIDPIKATNTIIEGKTKKVDIIKFKVNHITKYAMNLIGWGLVTDVGNMAEKFRWLGPSRYTILSIFEVLRYKSRSANLIIDGEKIKGDFTFIIACNSIHVGKGMKMAPKAKLDDGLLDLIIIKSGASRLRLLKVLPLLFTGEHINEPEVEYIQASNFSLLPQKDEILNIDGEILGKTPIEVNVLHKALEIFS